MTQELIANMLGVRREGVTEDRPKLEQLCCECYAVVKKETDRLLPH